MEKLPPKYRSLAEEVVKFGLIGGVNTAITFAVYNAILSIGAIKATLVAAVVATTVSYFLNRHWTYRHLPKTDLKREYTLFFVFNLIGMAIDSGIQGFAIYILDFNVKTDALGLNIFKFVALVIGTVFRFWAYRTFVFKAGKTGQVAVLADDPAPVSPAPGSVPAVDVAEAAEAAEAVDGAFADVLAEDALDEKNTPSSRLR